MQQGFHGKRNGACQQESCLMAACSTDLRRVPLAGRKLIIACGPRSSEVHRGLECKEVLLVTHHDTAKLVRPLLWQVHIEAFVDVVRLRHVDCSVQHHLRARSARLPDPLQHNVDAILRSKAGHEELHVVGPEAGHRSRLVVAVLPPVGVVAWRAGGQNSEFLAVQDVLQQPRGRAGGREWNSAGVVGTTCVDFHRLERRVRRGSRQ
mmetsp:Transcript_42032/g.76030  ORF Transcript_42032/g.76030 Transcript_42032/m.76030 type:complete len:207 (+) Transcript_42032:434-1054(+)